MVTNQKNNFRVSSNIHIVNLRLLQVKVYITSISLNKDHLQNE